MSRLEELIAELCPDGVEFLKIKDVYARLRGTPITAEKMKEIDNPDGDVRIFAGGKTVINAFEEDIPKANITRVPAVLVQSRGVIDAIYYEEPFTFKNEMWAYTADEKTSVKYLYYVLKNNIQQFRDAASGMGSLPQISLKVTEEFVIPVPPLSVQEEIVRILDNFTKLTARKKQYEYYREIILQFDDTVIRKPIGDICTIKGRVGWQRLTKAEYRESGDYYLVTGTDFRDDNSIDFEHCFYVDQDRYDQDENIQLKGNDVLLTKDGTIGKVAIIKKLKKPATLNSHLVVFRNYTGELLPRYLMHILKSSVFMKYAMAKCSKGTILGLPQNVIARFPISVPTLKEQERIVSVLDRFDTLCNDISVGLPAEIEARQKQYEYYRDKLLTFKELS